MSVFTATAPLGRTVRGLREMFRYSRIAIGGTLLIIVGLIAVFGPMIYSRSANALVGLPLEGRSGAHLFGTDEIGRDELARVILGGRISLLVAFIAVGVGLVAGGVIGLSAGHYGGKIETVLMRFVDGLQAFPALLLAIMIAAALGPGLVNVMIAIGVAFTPQFARLARSQALQIRHHDYVDAARLGGRRDAWIIFKHVLPNAASAMIILSATVTAQAILNEAALAFLGLGAEPPTPDWGSMLSGGYNYISLDPSLTIYPGAAIAITTLAFVFLGDGLRDWLDPRSSD